MYEEKAKQLSRLLEIIPCGGINSKGRLVERLNLGISHPDHVINEFQIYTPFVFSGPKLLREFRSYLEIVLL